MPENLKQIVLSLFVFFSFGTGCYLSLYFFQIRYFFAGILGTFLLVLGLVLMPSQEWFRGIPFLCFFIFIVLLLFSVLRKKTKDVPLFSDRILALSFFSFALSFRIFFKAGPDNYGFFLLDPGLVCFFIVLFLFFPSCKIKKIILSESYKIKYRLLFLLISSGLLYPLIERTFFIYSIKQIPLSTSFGTLYCEHADRTYNFLKTVEYLKNQTAPDSKVLVFPEGILINLLSGRKSPLRYAEFLPHGIERFGEERLIREMEKQGTDYIVLVNLQTTPYEFHYFGIDYAVKIMNWIWTNYEQCALFGPMPFTDEGFGYVIFKRK